MPCLRFRTDAGPEVEACDPPPNSECKQPCHCGVLLQATCTLNIILRYAAGARGLSAALARGTRTPVPVTLWYEACKAYEGLKHAYYQQ
jgi:hypothetical protein